MNNNQMDISSRIKFIVEPYEKKIKNLEDQLRQKDFEIVVLKEKLNNAENNTLNGMPMGMGMCMGMPYPMFKEPIFTHPLNNEKNEDSDIVNLIFKFQDREEKIEQRCFLDDEFSSVQKKVLQKINVNTNIKFIFNSKNVNSQLTISELGMKNNSYVLMLPESGIINDYLGSLDIQETNNIFTSKINIIFTTTSGVISSMSFDDNISIGLAIQKYLIRMGQEGLINSQSNHLTFLFNARKYQPNDTIKLKELFGIRKSATIVVNDTHNIIGAKESILINRYRS